MIRNKQLIAVGCIMEGAYLSFFAVADPVDDVALFIGVNAFCYAILGYLAFLCFRPAGERVESDSIDNGKWGVRIVLGFALIFRLTLVFHDPVASDDIYRYLWDGKVAAAGYNPFEFAPSDPLLESLHTETLPSMINFPEMRTIYPPLAQGFFAFSYFLSGDSPAGMKFLLVLFDLCSVLLLFRLTGTRLFFSSRPKPPPEERRLPALAILYAWSPLPIMYFALDGHVDGLGIPFLLLFIMFAANQRSVRSAVALGFGALAKLYPLLAVPFLPRFNRTRNRCWLPLIPILLLVAGYELYLEPTGGVFESLLIYNTRFEFNGLVYSLMRLVASPGVSRILCGAILLSWLGFLYVRNLPMEETLLLTFLGFLMVSPTAHPWYFTWLAALITLRWSWSVFLLLGLTNLSNLVVYGYRLTGIWEGSAWIQVIEYLPFLIVLVWEVRTGRLMARSGTKEPA